MAKDKAAPPEEIHFPDAKVTTDVLKKYVVKTPDGDGVSDDVPTGKLIDLLAISRDTVRTLKSAFDDTVRKFAEKMKPFETERAKYNKILKQCDEAFSAAMYQRLKRDGDLPPASDKGTTLSIRRTPVLALKDENVSLAQIPQEFRLPVAQCVDWSAVTMHIEATGKLPGFVKQSHNISFTTKLAEVVE